MLELKNVTKSFIQRGMVLDNLSLDAEEGDSIAIMGPSGSGKTTLMNIIGLLDKPESGEITFRGSDIGKYTDNESAVYRSSNVGFVFQDHLLLPHLTVLENILLPLLATGQSREALAIKEERVKRLMKQTGISAISGKYPFLISGGEAQRAALVRALVNNPSLLLADEPTGSLDAGNAEIMGNLLAEVNREYGTAIILATHSSKLAEKMSRTLILSEGKLIKRN
jgi:lipoprotein-releasing system ATP-binding protein